MDQGAAAISISRVRVFASPLRLQLDIRGSAADWSCRTGSLSSIRNPFR